MQNCVGSRSVVFGHESVVLGVLVLKDGARSSGVWGGGTKGALQNSGRLIRVARVYLALG